MTTINIDVDLILTLRHDEENVTDNQNQTEEQMDLDMPNHTENRNLREEPITANSASVKQQLKSDESTQQQQQSQTKNTRLFLGPKDIKIQKATNVFPVDDFDEDQEEYEVVGQRQVMIETKNSSPTSSIPEGISQNQEMVNSPDSSPSIGLPNKVTNPTQVRILQTEFSPEEASNKSQSPQLSLRLEEKLKTTTDILTCNIDEYFQYEYVSPLRNKKFIYRKLKNYPRIIESIMKYLTNEEKKNFWPLIKSELGRNIGHYLNELVFIQKYHVTEIEYLPEGFNYCYTDNKMIWNPLGYFFESTLREFNRMILDYWSLMLNDFLLEILSSTFDLHIDVTSAKDTKFLVEYVPTKLKKLDQIRVINLVIVDDVYFPLNAPLGYPIEESKCTKYSQLLQEFLKGYDSINRDELANDILTEYDTYNAYYYEQVKRIDQKITNEDWRRYLFNLFENYPKDKCYNHNFDEFILEMLSLIYRAVIFVDNYDSDDSYIDTKFYKEKRPQQIGMPVIPIRFKYTKKDNTYKLMIIEPYSGLLNCFAKKYENNNVKAVINKLQKYFEADAEMTSEAIIFTNKNFMRPTPDLTIKAFCDKLRHINEIINEIIYIHDYKFTYDLVMMVPLANIYKTNIVIYDMQKITNKTFNCNASSQRFIYLEYQDGMYKIVDPENKILKYEKEIQDHQENLIKANFK